MREERLIERIRLFKKSPQQRGKPDPKRIIDSIIRHLERILNTRWGSAQIADDFGVPDFSDMRSGFPDALRDLEHLIRNTITKYEPRLQSVRVKFLQHDENMLALSFQIIGKLVLEGNKDPVIFESMMDSEGKVTIRN